MNCLSRAKGLPERLDFVYTTRHPSQRLGYLVRHSSFMVTEFDIVE
jgi:hypothetical protein